MTSPFPGMDPYLESPTHWSDFHFRFINRLADAINERLPDQFVTRVGEHVMAVTPVLPEAAGDEGDTAYLPDITVVDRLANLNPLPTTGQPAGGGAGAATLMPTVVGNVRYADDYAELFLEVLRLPDMAVVTVIELLSPTNKYGEGRGIYGRKRRRLLARPVHIVELDLLRAGPRLRFDRPIPAGHYLAFVSRADQRPMTEAYAWSVRDPLPAVPVPLDSAHPDVMLPLGEPFVGTYRAARYGSIIDYAVLPPRPPFSTDDAEWVAGRIRNRNVT